MSAFQNRRKLWVYRMEKLSGCAPLDFKMARYIEKLNIRSPEQLRYALEHNQQVVFVGFKAMNKLRVSCWPIGSRSMPVCCRAAKSCAMSLSTLCWLRTAMYSAF